VRRPKGRGGRVLYQGQKMKSRILITIINPPCPAHNISNQKEFKSIPGF
jgi:hypothetical protein